MSGDRKILLLEFNEISWQVVDRLVEQRGSAFLPNFARLRRDGASALQTAVERPPLLDPWITWVTLHTGVPPSVHGASVLEQDDRTIAAKRSWQYAADAGRTVGVFGSIAAYPPATVDGFIVPGPFAPGDETHPPGLEIVQAINRRYTRAHGGTGRAPSATEAAGMVVRLLRLGLSARTCLRIAAQLVRERAVRHQRGRRVGLQPLLNFDLFEALVRRVRPDFATWHTNHAAHYMHHYWRAWDDTGFASRSPPEERARFGEAVPHGYRVCDALLGRAFDLADERTVVVVASSMGQQPYRNAAYADGKIVVRLRQVGPLLDLIGRDGIETAVPTMVPQWNLVIPDAGRRSDARRRLEAVRRTVGPVDEPGISVRETGDVLTITPYGLASRPAGIAYRFPGGEGRPDRVVPMEALFVADAPTVKQGMHDPDGLLAFHGADIRPGLRLAPCTNLDVAPTLLWLMGIAPPPVMHGRVLRELVA